MLNNIDVSWISGRWFIRIAMLVVVVSVSVAGGAGVPVVVKGPATQPAAGGFPEFGTLPGDEYLDNHERRTKDGNAIRDSGNLLIAQLVWGVTDTIPTAAAYLSQHGGPSLPNPLPTDKMDQMKAIQPLRIWIREQRPEKIKEMEEGYREYLRRLLSQTLPGTALVPAKVIVRHPELVQSERFEVIFRTVRLSNHVSVDIFGSPIRPVASYLRRSGAPQPVAVKPGDEVNWQARGELLLEWLLEQDPKRVKELDEGFMSFMETYCW